MKSRHPRPSRPAATPTSRCAHSRTLRHKTGDGIAGPQFRDGIAGPRLSHAGAAGPLRRPLHFEPLEDRRLLAVLTVNSLADSVDLNDGQLTLREAIFAANTVPGADEIRFDPALFANGAKTILLTHGEMTITDSLTISGPGANALIVDASGNDPTVNLNNGDGSRVFNITDNTSVVFDVTLNAMTLMGGDVALYGGAVQSLENLILSNCIIRDNAATRGGGVYASNVELSIIDCDLTANVATTASDSATGRGGGVACYGGVLFLQRGHIDRNVSTGGGGGAWFSFASGFNGEAKFDGVTITGNVAETGNGGGIGFRGIPADLGGAFRLDVVDSLISGNAAFTGGGVYVGNSSASISKTALRDNSAADRGGGLLSFDSALNVSISVFESNNAGGNGGGAATTGALQQTSFERCLVARNVSGQSGGGLSLKPSRTFVGTKVMYSPSTIKDCTITGNQASVDGGGVFGLRTTIQNSLVQGNRAGVESASISRGGGVYFADLASTSPDQISNIEESTICHNVASRSGGGVYAASCTITNCTISGNAASRGGGAAGLLLLVQHSTITDNSATFLNGTLGTGGGVAANATLDHTIVAGNHAEGHFPDFSIATAKGQVRFSIIGDVSGSTLTEAPLGAPDSGGNLIGGPLHGPIDPLLAPLADNGGPALPGGAHLLTRALLPGSPALDAGDPAAVAGLGDTPQFDQRGAPYSRVIGRIDIGAVEQIPATLIVDALDDNSDGNYSTGHLSLREAIEMANLQPGAQSIQFDPALFVDGPKTILLTHGELKILGALSIVGPGADLLTVDASGNDTTPGQKNADGTRVFSMAASSVSVSLSGMLLTGGDVRGSGGAISAVADLALSQMVITDNATDQFTSSGGGVAAKNLTVEDSAITGNSAGFFGGGIYASGTLSIKSSTISGNSIGGPNHGQGGGVFASGRAYIEYSHIDNNTAGWNRAGSGGTAAGIFSSNYLSLKYSEVRGNRATGEFSAAGGVFLSSRSVGTSRISASIISDNHAAAGGGVFSQTRNLEIADSLISGNSATGKGGGFYGQFSALVRSTVASNSARLGGAMYAIQDFAGTRILNSTISGNSALDSGGGLFVKGSPYLGLRHSTIADNTADKDDDGLGTGGGIFGRVTLDHVLVATNYSGAGLAPSDISNGMLAVSAAHSLIGSNAGTAQPEARLGAPDANDNLIGGPVHGTIDPLLAPLADNGGFFQLPTHALLPGSPALDAGDPLAKAGGLNIPLFDQRDVPFSRVVGRAPDIGAIEQIPTTLLVDALDDNSDGNYSTGHLSLREAIELANIEPGAQTIQFDPAIFTTGPKTILLKHGELKATEGLSIEGPGAELLTIDASGNDPTPDLADGSGSRVFDIQAPSSAPQSTLSGMKVTGGDPRANGGGIFSSSDLFLAKMVITENTTGFVVTAGGGVFASRNLTVEDSVVSNNLALLSGGGIAGGRMLFIRNSAITGNTAGSQGGGIATFEAVGIRPDFQVYIENSDISNNRTLEATNNSLGGGGIALQNVKARISGSTITNNTSARNGGGVSTSAYGSVVEDTLIAGNHANRGGGWYGPLKHLNRSTLSENSATDGGGLYIAKGLTSGILTINSSTISGNTAFEKAGGLWIPTRADINNATIANNRASSGVGGIYGAPILDYTIVAGNFNGQTPSDLLIVNIIGVIPVASHSLIGTNVGTLLKEAPLGAPDANGNLIGGPLHGAIDPLLAPLADNGGPALPGGARLLTHALLPGSPALNAGDPNFQPGLAGAPEFDQRGAPFTRLAGPRIDIGAYEQQPAGGVLTADFDFSGRTDGADFLTWQRNVGRTAGATYRQGDATADADVDSNDFAVWAARFGSSAAPTAAAPINVAAIRAAAISALALEFAPSPSLRRAGLTEALSAKEQVARDAFVSRHATVTSSSPNPHQDPLIPRVHDAAFTVRAHPSSFAVDDSDLDANALDAALEGLAPRG